MTGIRANAIRVLIVDDHPLMRAGLAGLIESEPGLEVCGEAGDVAEGLRLAGLMNPDLAIIDISLKDGHGIELIKEIRARNEHVKMLVSSMYEEALYAERALRAGAMGYVNKRDVREKVIEAIHSVLAGKRYLSQELTERMVSRAIGSSGDIGADPISLLSDRELEVFELLGQGLTTRRIASRMHLSPKTVETYRENIKSKLNLSNATELTRHAVQWVLENA